MSFLEECEGILWSGGVGGPYFTPAMLTTNSTAERFYVGDDGSSNAILVSFSTDQSLYLSASSSGSEITATSTDEAFYLLNTETLSPWLIYKGHMPDSTAIISRAVAIIQTPGQGRMGRIDMEQPRLTIIVRGQPQNQASSAYPEAETKMTEAVTAMHEYTGTARTFGTHWVGTWCESGPTFDGFDEGWRPHFSAEFRIMRATT